MVSPSRDRRFQTSHQNVTDSTGPVIAHAYDWQRRQSQSAIETAGGRERIAQLGIALLTLGFGVIGLVATTTPDGTAGSFGRTVAVSLISASTVPVAIIVTKMRITRFWWGRNQSLISPNNLFVIYADFGLVGALCTVQDRLMALHGVVLFAIIGGFVAHFVRIPIMYAHIAFSSLAIVGFAWLAFFAGAEPGTIAYFSIVSLAASNGIVLLLHAYTTVFKQALRTQLHSANTDPLTGVLNRRGFAASAPHVLSGDTKAVLMMLDVDRFKQINDLHGHPIGDAILHRLAHQIIHLAGSDAVVGRLGGDEFAIAVQVAEDPQAVVERVQKASPGMLHGSRVTVSVGALICNNAPPNADESTWADLAEAMAIADRALIRAKNSGRNTYYIIGSGEIASPEAAEMAQAPTVQRFGTGDHPHVSVRRSEMAGTREAPHAESKRRNVSSPGVR